MKPKRPALFILGLALVAITADEAIPADSLITLRSLSSSFPAAHGGAFLSYAQSRSLVAYLIDAHGWEKIRELLAVFQEGSTYDDALHRVYGFDMGALDEIWRRYVGVQ